MEGNVRMKLRRRQVLAGAAALAAAPVGGGAAAPPRMTITSQWSAGNDLHAMDELGKRFTSEGGVWQHDPVPGGTVGMMNKVRAQIMAGDPPAVSQLKGPEIAVWSKVSPTANLDSAVAAAGFEKLLPAQLIKLHKPFGEWISLPVQLFRTNTLYIS
jgi:glucose/mannose transport system substrate-binding protein